MVANLAAQWLRVLTRRTPGASVEWGATILISRSERHHESKCRCQRRCRHWRLLEGVSAGRVAEYHQRSRLHCPERHALHRQRGLPGRRFAAHNSRLDETAAVFHGRTEKGGPRSRRENSLDTAGPQSRLHRRDNEIIVGLQTDQPFKRAIFPFGGLRMVEDGLKAAGFEPDPTVHEAFTKYRKSTTTVCSTPIRLRS